ncbi:MAG: hypothetical protein AAB824_00660 [Patescibacteria group bacterium]
MNKNIIVVVLVVLLLASVGWAWSLQQGKIKLGSEKEALQNKIDKGLTYAKALDLLLEPARKQAGLPTRQPFSETDWILSLTEATKATADNELQSNFNDIKEGGSAASRASIFFMDRAVSATVDALK